MTWRRVAALLFIISLQSRQVPANSTPSLDAARGKSLDGARGKQDEDLGRLVEDSVYEYKFRPIAGWVADTKVKGGLIVRFKPPGSTDTMIPSFDLRRVNLPNPTPVETFAAGLKEWIKADCPEAKIIREEKDFKIGERHGYLIEVKWTSKEGGSFATLKAIIPRTNYEVFVIDALCTEEDSGKLFKAFEKSIATFEIAPRPLNKDERAAQERGEEFLKKEKDLRADLFAETWLGIYFSGRRVGYHHIKTAETAVQGNKGTRIEAEIVVDFGEGGKDHTQIKCHVSPDFSYQQVESVQTITTEKNETISYRATGTLEKGELKVTREMKGVKESRTLAVGNGVILSDVAHLVRRAILSFPKGTFLFKTIDLFSDEVGWDSMEIMGKDKVEYGPKDKKERREEKQVMLVFNQNHRGRNLVYKYGLDKTLAVIQAEKGTGTSLFVEVATSKEEATGADKK